MQLGYPENTLMQKKKKEKKKSTFQSSNHTCTVNPFISYVNSNELLFPFLRCER